MSCNYADGLSPYPDKGQLGLQEKFDSKSVIAAKVDMLSKWIRKANHVVIHTGAGISTSAGIPDFRGPRGVWTLQEKGVKPDISTDFNEATPTSTHMAITRLVEQGKVKYIVSQNIDGLHLRSGLPRKALSELHGNMFVEQCNVCNRQFVRNSAVPTVGQKSLSKACPTIKPTGRNCRGRLHDTILDWEHNLPENDLAMADFHSCLADVSIALGTTMQIVPSGSLPLYTKKAGGKLVIVNLQPTKHDAKADLLIHGYVDDVVNQLMKLLSMKIPKYSPKNDPTKLSLSSDKYFEWTISDKATQEMRVIYEAKCGTREAKKRLDLIDDDDLPLMARVKKRKCETDEQPTTKTRHKKEKQESSTPEVAVLEEIGVTPRIKSEKQTDSSKKKRNRNKYPTVPPHTKLTIKKNVTPTKTKYEIVPSRSERLPAKIKCEIVHETNDDTFVDLEMTCESDDDGPNVYATNFRQYLHDDKTFKREDKPDIDAIAGSSTVAAEGISAEVANKDMKKEKEESKTESKVNSNKESKQSKSDDKTVSRENSKNNKDKSKKSTNDEIVEVSQSTVLGSNDTTATSATNTSVCDNTDSKREVNRESKKSEAARSEKTESKGDTATSSKSNASEYTDSLERNINETPKKASAKGAVFASSNNSPTVSKKSAEAASSGNASNIKDIATATDLAALSSDVDLPPINENILYGASDLDLYGNY